jgi:hypothetical protein
VNHDSTCFVRESVVQEDIRKYHSKIVRYATFVRHHIYMFFVIMNMIMKAVDINASEQS